MREVGGSDQGGVAPELHQLPRANENGAEFQNSETLSGSGGYGRLHVEEGYLGSFFLHFCSICWEWVDEKLGAKLSMYAAVFFFF